MYLSPAYGSSLPASGRPSKGISINNPDYRWRHDGVPSSEYVKLLDDYAGFSRGCAPERYRGIRFPERFRDAFDAAFDRTEGFEDHYERSAALREQSPPGMADVIRSLVEGPWLRSTLYRLLGGGVRRDGSVAPRHSGLSHVSDATVQELRKLVDRSWYIAIDESLGVPSRYPGTPPVELLVPQRKSLSLLEDDSAWENAALIDREVGSCFVTGDLKFVLRGVGDLDLTSLQNLRSLKSFSDFRQLYGDFETRYRLNRAAALSDVVSLREISKSSVAALKELGRLFNVTITESDHTSSCLRFIANSPVGRRLVAQGLVIAFNYGTGLAAPSATASLADASLVWLTMHLQQVGLRNAPIHLHAESECLGPVEH